MQIFAILKTFGLIAFKLNRIIYGKKNFSLRNFIRIKHFANVIYMCCIYDDDTFRYTVFVSQISDHIVSGARERLQSILAREFS